jgi:hypothetical protein
LNLSTLDGRSGFRINGEGESARERSGLTVSAAGDVNGDGFDDVIIGALGGNGNDSGASYVVFGSAKWQSDPTTTSIVEPDGDLV